MWQEPMLRLGIISSCAMVYGSAAGMVGSWKGPRNRGKGKEGVSRACCLMKTEGPKSTGDIPYQ